MLFFKVIKIIPNRVSIDTRHLVLIQRIACIRLRGARRFQKLYPAVALDAHTSKSDARHRTLGVDLPLDASGDHVLWHFTYTAIRVASGVHVRSRDAGVVPTLSKVIRRTLVVIISPGADAATRPAAWTNPRFLSGCLLYTSPSPRDS